MISGRVYVAGCGGLVGSAITRELERQGIQWWGHRHNDVDLTWRRAVDHALAQVRPHVVFMCAGVVGGIADNSARPATFIRDNLEMTINIIEMCATYRARLCFLGSSCIYPRDCPQPIREEYLMTGPLEPTNSAYAMAKLAGIEMCRAYRKQYGLDSVVVQPCNLYGPGDHYDLERSHVLPAMIRRFHEAKVSRSAVQLWGDGSALREFLHVDDLARACVMLMNNPDPPEIVNVGSGKECSISELAFAVASVVGFDGVAHFDPSRPNGTPRKLLDSSKMRALGWVPTVSLADGLRDTYAKLAAANFAW